MKLHFYTDPGHGWLRTTIQTLEKFGISEKVSNYSYREGNIVYLEEDCDAPLLMKAMKAKGIDVKLEEHFTESQSTIRYKKPYQSGV